MAVVDKYINDNIENGLLANTAFDKGSEELTSVHTEEIAAADEDGSKYRIIKGLTGHEIITEIMALADAITNGTDYDLGFYKSNGGAVKDADVLADGIDFSSGFARASEQNMLTNVAIADIQKKVFELAGDSVPDADGYDLVLTCNTVGTVAGTVSFFVKMIQG